MSERSKRYRAFISYSQKDKAHARRLHQALERYRLPKGVEAAGVDIKTRKLGRFFRDDEEMGAATDLGAALQGAIADAENLIVVCSPNAAQSKWVNEEIIHFKRTGRADKIFAVVAAGAPHSADEHECFPPALRFALESDGALTDQQAEPLAVDVRKESFARVLTRLVAGLAQLPFDALWKREQRRAAAQAVTLSLGLFFVTLLVGGAVTQSIWYPRVDAYWRYARHSPSTEELMATEPGRTFQDCREGSTDCPVMVVIPEGTFLMGEAPAQATDEQGQVVTAPDERRRIPIARFAVSQNEVTFADWQRCFDAGACGNEMPNRSGYEGDNLPVINVSWEDAQKYVTWLEGVTGLDYRLLTEAEWEYAARGVTSADDPRNGESWSFGNDESQLGEYAWFSSNSDGQPHPMGTRHANPFGLNDMHGNVWEWVQDCYAAYDPSMLDGVAVESDAGAPGVSGDETSCSNRVRRGGSSINDPGYLRSANRSWGNYRYISSGFRVARTITVSEASSNTLSTTNPSAPLPARTATSAPTITIGAETVSSSTSEIFGDWSGDYNFSLDEENLSCTGDLLSLTIREDHTLHWSYPPPASRSGDVSWTREGDVVTFAADDVNWTGSFSGAEIRGTYISPTGGSGRFYLCRRDN